MSEYSKNFDEREKELERSYSSTEDLTTSLPLMFDTGLVDIIKSKFPNESDTKERDYLFYALAIGFKDYFELGKGKGDREICENEMNKILAHYKLDKDSKIKQALKATYDLIDSRKGE